MIRFLFSIGVIISKRFVVDAHSHIEKACARPNNKCVKAITKSAHSQLPMQVELIGYHSLKKIGMITLIS